MLPWRLNHFWRSSFRICSLHTTATRRKYNDDIDSLGRWGNASLDVMEKVRLHVLTATNVYDTSRENLRRTTLVRQRRRFRRMQMISEESLEKLGEDVAVAEMVLRLGGAVRFQGADRWLTGSRNQFRRRALLPRDMVMGPNANYRLETIDLSNCPIMYEGLAYLRGLRHLRHLVLRNCAFVDDHCLSLLHHVRRSLLLLDLSRCADVSARGLATLWALHSLRRLNVEAMSAPELAEDKELVCLLLEERNPDLFIAGVDYHAALAAAHRQEAVRERSENFRQRLLETSEAAPALEAAQQEVREAVAWAEEEFDAAGAGPEANRPVGGGSA